MESALEDGDEADFWLINFIVSQYEISTIVAGTFCFLLNFFKRRSRFV